jgi:hypothetical protein
MNEGLETEKRSLGMRTPALVLVLAMVPLIGCANHESAVNLSPRAGGGFIFAVRTNTVMTENDDGNAERIRRVWLADALTSSGTCRSGYVVDTRRFVQPEDSLFANGGDIVYAGRCL